MFNSKPSGAEDGKFLVGTNQDFRQVTLIRNPRTDSDDGNILTASTAKALKFLIADSAFATQLSIDELITNGKTLAIIKKRYKKIYSYPLKKTPLFVLLISETSNLRISI